MGSAWPAVNSCCVVQTSRPQPLSTSWAFRRSFASAAAASRCGWTVRLNFSPGPKTNDGRSMATRNESPGGRRTEQVILAVVQLETARLADQVAKRHFDLRRMTGIVAGGEFNGQFGVFRGGDQQVHAVVARAALVNVQLPVAEPHRARLVGLDTEGLWFGEVAWTDRDCALPLAFSPAAPGHADPQRVVVGLDLGNCGQEQPENGDDDERPARAVRTQGRRLASPWDDAQKRTSLSDHRRPGRDKWQYG